MCYIVLKGLDVFIKLIRRSSIISVDCNTTSRPRPKSQLETNLYKIGKLLRAIADQKCYANQELTFTYRLHATLKFRIGP